MADKTDDEIIEEVGLENSEAEADNNETNEENIDELNIEEDPTQADSNETDDLLEEIKTDDNADVKKDENKKVQKKQPKIFRILIILVVVLVSLLSIGLILYFLGFFDPEEMIEEKPAKTVVQQKEKIPELEIDINQLDKNKLNKKLNSLTKHEIMNKHELEAEEQRIKEEEEKRKLAEQKEIEDKKKKMQDEIDAQYAKIEEEKKLLEQQQQQIKQEQENFLALQKELKSELEMKKSELLQELDTKNTKTQTPITKMEENNTVEKDENSSDYMTFMSFINVATLKGDLYKSYLDKLQNFEKNISLCRDQKNRIEIYFGPYSSNQERKKVYDALLLNGFKQAYLTELTKEEFEKRCKY